jgi:prenyltransferase beta subunit
MKRFTLVGLIVFCCWSSSAAAQAPTPEQRKATVAYVLSLQRDNGGFAADAGKDTPATLPATSAAVRALKYFGGALPRARETDQFILHCWDSATGGYAPTKGGQPDVRTTAVGLMARAEVMTFDANPSLRQMGAIRFLEREAKTFEDIRIAAAAFETLKLKPAKAGEWLAVVEKMRNPDGTYGQGGAAARETASAVVTVLRLGGTVENRAAVVKVIKDGQRPDGGWSRDGGASDLETTYRVMRALVMLQEKPNVPAVLGFVAKCRNADGSYSVQPGQPGTVSATYFASIIIHWAEQMK